MLESAKQRLTPTQAWERMPAWCARQERCQQDAYNKLRRHGLTEMEANEMISRLIEEGFINEERFARLYAGSHFRQKKWGKTKIEYALKQKAISPWCIKKALDEIDDEDAFSVLLTLATRKWQSLGRVTPPQRWAKTRFYLLQKGYAAPLVQQALNELKQSPPEV